jgi:hypothetical protein
LRTKKTHTASSVFVEFVGTDFDHELESLTKSIDVLLHLPIDKNNVVKLLNNIGGILDSLGSMELKDGVPKGLGIVHIQVVNKSGGVFLA